MSELVQAAVMPGSILAFSFLLRSLTPFLDMCSRESRAWVELLCKGDSKDKKRRRKKQRKS